MSTSSTAETASSHRLLMDHNYRLQRHFYDASRKYYLLGRDRLIDRLLPPAGARVLEIGCGTARNLIGVARRYPDARLHGVDISEQMLRTAQRSICRYGLEQRVRLVREDACSFDPAPAFGAKGFDRIYFSYALSMIPDWRKALAHAASLLNPGAELHIVDFGACEQLPSWFRRSLWAWLSHFHVSPRLSLAAELDTIAARHGGRVSLQSIYRGYAVVGVLKAG